MKKLLLILAMFFLPIAILAEKVKINGIYYNLNESEKTAEVTYETRSFNENTYSGELIIPKEITHGNETYIVTSIGEYAFSNCSNLTFVTIPNSVISIGSDAFENSGWYNNQPEGVIYLNNFLIGYKGEKPIGKFTITDGTTLIADRALEDCSELTSISLPNSLIYIGKKAFRNCSGLTSVAIPNGVISIDDRAFQNCNYLISVTIPNSVQKIGGGIFEGCSGLTSAIIPNGITSIKWYTFWGCSSLTSVSIPNSITSIEEGAFSGCKLLNTLTIPSNVVSIGREAFAHCEKINSIVIPVGVTKIDIGTFMHCFNLNSVNFPESLLSIDTDAFYECYNLESVNIPNTVNSIGERAFYGCRNITSLAIPEDIQIIKKQTFFGCSALKNVRIPSKVEFIYQEAFANCSSLEQIEVFSSNPPFLYDNSFSDFSVPLKVPKGCKDAYLAAQGWKNFTNISDANKYRLIYMVDNVEYKSFEIEEGAIITPEPTPTKEGYDFSGWSTIPATMPAEDVTITGTFTQLTDEDEITIKEIGKTTWCSKYDLDFTNVAGIKAYTATGYNDVTKTIWLTRVMEVPAGTGILVKGDAGTYKIPHVSVRAYYTNMLVGNLGDAIKIEETDGDKTNYYLSGKDGSFVSVNGNANIGKNKAYLQLPTSVFGGTRSIGISYDDEDGTTSIKDLTPALTEGEGAWYTLQGQRVAKPGKGLYIRNGKKVIVR